MKTFFVFFISFLMISGCAVPKLWFHETKNKQEFEVDRRECLYEAEKYTGLSSYSTGPAYGAGGNIAAGIADGMGQALIEDSRRGKLFTLCMQSRGYVSGERKGIVGIQLDLRSYVIAVVRSSSADLAGVRVHDQLIKIDGVGCLEMSYKERIDRVSGPIGTEVELVFLRDGSEFPRLLRRQ